MLPDPGNSGIRTANVYLDCPKAREGCPMLLGRPARRIAPLILSAALTFPALGGCNALPWSSRLPDVSEVKTRLEGEHSKTATAPARVVEATGDQREALEPIGESSPLPPAIERPANDPREAASTPLIDEALVRAEAQKQGPVEAPAKDVPKSTLVAMGPPPNPFPAEPADPRPEVTPPAKPVDPSPAPPVAEPQPAVAPAPGPKSPETTWREGVQTLRAAARDRLSTATKDTKPGAPNWAVRERLLIWLAEPDIDPDARSAGEIAQGRAVLKGLATLLDPTAQSASRGAEIREAVAALEAGAPLEIADLKLCRMVHGFGNIEPLEPASRKAGQSVVLYSEIDGLAYEPAGTGFRSRVDGKIELIPEGSEAPAWSHALPTVEDACRKRRRDYFIGHKFTLPDTLPPGNYRLRLTQRDLVADHVATRETTIAVVK